MPREFSERTLDAGENTNSDEAWPDLLERSGANSVFSLVLSRWPTDDETQNFVVECKLRHKNLETDNAEGLKQTSLYTERCGADGDQLVIFDRSSNLQKS